MRKGVAVLKRELWGLLSLYVRRRASTGGFVRCYTCNRMAPISEMHAGHYLSRRHLATCFDLRNIRPQCPACNVLRAGEPAKFRALLEVEIGAEEVADLVEASRKNVVLNRGWYEAQITEYKQKIKQLGA